MTSTTRRYTVGALAAVSSLAILAAPQSAAAPPEPSGVHAVHDGTRLTIDEYEFSVAVPMWLRPGTYTFATNNTGRAPHDLVISTLTGMEIGRTAVVDSGGMSELTVTLQPGVYQFWCSVGGHRERGMNTFVVVL
ncbi:hypothetical protein [Nocardia sp. XZ_19_385]|uniref:hypothetical protein n=1 Tax=Nocardia sp. XZ_19_385 TaxID=2769488 RepID=UPI00188F71A4|nr:hypothetical protein [Nocardia sp. XZ_19_385]